MRKMGRPRSSEPYGITDPKGNPCCLRERVDRLPMRPKYTKVRARSENEGSGTVGWSLAAPVPLCFLMEEDIAAHRNSNQNGSNLPALSLLPRTRLRRHPGRYGWHLAVGTILAGLV